MEDLKHVEAATKIYFTTDYGRFKFMKGNRDLIERKINKIVDAIEQGVDILKYAPIIVNKDMEIVDGQHRFAVSKQLRTNVYYVIKEDAELSIVPTINSNSTKWKTADFLASYVDLGKIAYKALQAFVESFPGMSIQTGAKMLHAGTVVAPKVMEAFRDGLLTTEHLDDAYDYAQMLKDFTPYIDNPYGERMFRVASLLKDNGKYDHDLMLKKLEASGKRIDEVSSPKTIINQMELIINHHSQKRIIIH
jgi:hypothetical protein